MSKTSLKYFMSMCLMLLSVNILLFTATTSYLDSQQLGNNSFQQNSPQKRTFSTSHNSSLKYFSENNELDDDEVEEQEDELKQLSDLQIKEYFRNFLVSLPIGNLLSKPQNGFLGNFFSHYFTSLDSLCISYRVFRL